MADEVKPMGVDKDYIIGLLVIVVFGILGLALLYISHAHADTWKKCKPGTLIRTEPEPRCVGIGSEILCPECLPATSCIESEKEAAECKRINTGLLAERDGFEALYQREAADNRRCKRSLKKCRRRK